MAHGVVGLAKLIEDGEGRFRAFGKYGCVSMAFDDSLNA